MKTFIDQLTVLNNQIKADHEELIRVSAPINERVGVAMEKRQALLQAGMGHLTGLKPGDQVGRGKQKYEVKGFAPPESGPRGAGPFMPTEIKDVTVLVLPIKEDDGKGGHLIGMSVKGLQSCA